ncbi:MAG: hypothetical protein KDE53_23700, partial [Caldilineaceae bacterium]|nr:hypothetical protein [Caldilineaceae bacterium]
DFHLDRQFPFIFARGCVFDFLLTRVDQEAMFACVHEHLADDGQFLFDVCGTRSDRMVEQPEPVPWYTVTHPNGRQIYASGTSHFDHINQLWIQRCYQHWDNAEGELMQPPWTLTLRYTMPVEIETLLHYNGFVIVERYGDYDG